MERQKIKIGVIVGGKNPGHNREEIIHFLYKCQSSSSDYRLDVIELNKCDITALSDYSVLIIWTSLESALDSQLDAFIEFGNLSNKFLIFFHESAIYNKQHLAFTNFLGVRFSYHDPYQLFTVVTHEHQITKNLPTKFKIIDEKYYYLNKITKDNIIILFTDENNYVLGFEKNLYNYSSKLIYIALGHDKETISNNNFILMWKNIFRYIDELNDY